MTTSSFAVETPSFTSDLSSLPRLSDLPKPPVELQDLEPTGDFGRRGATEPAAPLRARGAAQPLRAEPVRAQPADRNRADRDPLNRSDLSAADGRGRGRGDGPGAAR